MNSEYHRIDEFDEFSLAKEKFSALVSHLHTPEAENAEHGDIEALIEEKGREVLRCVMQGYLALKTATEKKASSVVGRDGQERAHCRSNCQRQLATLFGEVRVGRYGYGGRRVEEVFPMDAALNLPDDKYSHGIRKVVANDVAIASFEEACDRLEERTGYRMPKRQLEGVARYVAQDFDSYYAQKEMGGESGEDLLIMSLDAKGIVVRIQDLRKATREAAQRESHKLKTRLSRGEKKNRKRMATVTAIYDVAPYVRCAREILSLGEEEKSQKRPKVSNKRLWASVINSIEAAVRELIGEAKKRDPCHKRT